MVMSVLDDFLAKRRELEARFPTMPRFDESAFPPKRSWPDETAWMRACIEVLMADTRRIGQEAGERIAAIERGQAGYVIARALGAKTGKA